MFHTTLANGNQLLHDPDDAIMTNTIPTTDTGNVSHYLSKWDRLLHDPDDARVWKALDWKGKFTDNAINNDLPSDEEFKHFYETYLNQYGNDSHIYEFDNDNNVNVPILDNPIIP